MAKAKKKKRKYVRKDKSNKLFSDIKSEPVLNTDYTTEVEEDNFWQAEEDIIEKDAVAESEEPKPEEKKPCSICVEIDNALKRSYILYGGIALTLIIIYWASKKGNINPKIIGFFYGIFAMMFVWNTTLIFSFKRLREKFVEQ